MTNRGAKNVKYLYEFIGTFFLVFTVGMTVLGPNSAGIMAPLAIGLRRKLSLKDLGRYWIVQLAAGILAGYLTIYYKGYPTQPSLPLETMKAFLAEFLFTFALCYVVLNVAIAKATKGNSFYGWAIGFTVLIGAYSVGSISGAAFNPAVALGITIMKLSIWSNLWIFFAANLLGGACAALIFKAVDKKA
jgi:aquaporin Z